MKTAIIMGIVALLGSAASATAALVVKDDAGSEKRAVSSSHQARAATYRVILAGFTATGATWDHALEVDGKGDEVFVSTRIVYRERGKKTSDDEFSTPIMGDTNNYPNRTKAGSASALGGIRNGDTFPAPLNKRARPNEEAEVPPLELWSDELVQGRAAVVITPTVWEHDGVGDDFGGWLAAGKKVLPKVAAAADKALSGKSSGGITSWTQLGLSVLTVAWDVAGKPGDRPIGTTVQRGKNRFNPQSIVLTYQSAERLAKRRIGGVKGLIALQYRDHPDFWGNYTLWLRIERVPT
jgi:hypothetical protein